MPDASPEALSAASQGAGTQTNVFPPSVPLFRETESKECRDLKEQKLNWATRSGENLGRIKSALEDEIKFLTTGQSNDTFLKNSIAVIAGIVFTWIIFWCYLSWDNFSSFYGRDSWASFIAINRGDGSISERITAATLFVLQIMSGFLLVYSIMMYVFTKKKIYVWQALTAAVLAILTVILVGTGSLTA